MINAKPDGYKLAVVTVELVTLKPMGLAKFNQDDIQPIIQFNADPAAITVHADAPWNTLQEFLADARKTAGKVSVGNAGNGSIWHFAAARGEKTGIEFNHIPFQGASPPCRPCWASTWTRWPSARPRWRSTCSPAS